MEPACAPCAPRGAKLEKQAARSQPGRIAGDPEAPRPVGLAAALGGDVFGGGAADGEMHERLDRDTPDRGDGESGMVGDGVVGTAKGGVGRDASHPVQRGQIGARDDRRKARTRTGSGQRVRGRGGSGDAQM